MYFLKLNDVSYFSETFKFLEKYQQRFVYVTNRDDYRWSKAPLKEWSRCCEYPFIYDAISKYARVGTRVLDFGSGKNFLPFLLSDQGFHVTCLDPDDYSDFYCHYLDGKIPIQFESNAGNLKNKFDLIYSISVLEHTDNFTGELSKIASMLDDQGILLLTFDVDVRGDLSISMDKLCELQKFLIENFTPIDLAINSSGPFLTYLNSPFGFKYQSISFFFRRISGWVLRFISGRGVKNYWISPYDLRVAIYAGKRKN